MTVTFESFIRDVDGDVEFGELFFQDTGGFIDDLVAAGTAGNAAEEQEIFQSVEVGVVSDGVAEVDTDGAVDFGSTFIVFTAGFLHEFKDFGQRGTGGEVETGGFDQTSDGLL